MRYKKSFEDARETSTPTLSTKGPPHTRQAMNSCAKADAVESDGVDKRFIDMALRLADEAATVTTKFFRHAVSSS